MKGNEDKDGKRRAEKAALWISVLLVISLMVFSLSLEGCAPANNQAPQGNQVPAAPGGRGGGQYRNSSYRPGGMGNLTDEQRQQMMAQRLQQGRDACQGMAEGDACTMSNTRGNMTGTCKTLNETLTCSVNFGGRQTPGN